MVVLLRGNPTGSRLAARRGTSGTQLRRIQSAPPVSVHNPFCALNSSFQAFLQCSRNLQPSNSSQITHAQTHNICLSSGSRNNPSSSRSMQSTHAILHAQCPRPCLFPWSLSLPILPQLSQLLVNSTSCLVAPISSCRDTTLFLQSFLLQSEAGTTA